MVISADPGPRAGQIIKGYELIDLLGQGGFGVVYRARQPLVERDVAIKIVLPQYASQPEFVRRFEAEARLVAQLESPAIVPLYDYWRDPDGAFLVMRLLRGGNLETALTQGAWSLPETDRLLDQITSALSVAHRNGIVHRDLKPANILLDEDRNVYLSDFGIAKNLRLTGKYDEVVGLTGSPAYMSPEQIRQQPVSPQTDIYSLGIVLYEVINGRQLFSGSSTTELLMKQLNEPVHNHLPNADMPDAIYAVIERATRKDPAQRFSDMRAFYAAFHQALISIGSVRPVNVAAADGDSAIELLELLDLGDFTFDSAALVNPYKGLRAFQEGDAADFFGREALIDQLASRLTEKSPLARFLAVIGPSGSGKSSVVKAGLIPALKHGVLPGADQWFMVEMTPGAHPLEQLANALLSIALTPQSYLAERLRASERGLLDALDQLLLPNAQLLLVIDQFEETFTQVSDEAERLAFLDSLRVAVTDPDSRVRIIMTLRADFYDRPLLYQAFGDLVRQRTEVVLPLAASELERAIVGPAERIGLHVEPGLIAAIIADLREEPGTLPLLQYALTEVYERRDGRLLTLAAYQQSGGALGALARRAEELYEQSDPNAQAAIRQLFLRLVTLGEGTEDTRRRARWTEIMALASGAGAIQNILDLYGRYRLLTFDRDMQTRERTIEVAHEALIREWTRLRGWLDENREELRLERRLTTASDEWRTAGRNPDFLASGTRLTQFEELTRSGKLTINPGDLEYIRASVEKREKQQASEARQQIEDERMKRRQQALGRGLLIGVLVTLLSVGLAAFALIQGQIAQQERGHALDSAATAMNAQGLAVVQANLADQNAMTATNAQGQALVQANNAATQAAIAQNNAMTATNAQGQALVQANNAATQAAIAQNNAVTATIAQGQALAQANIANQNAMTATNAQGQALIQANNAATQAAIAQNNAVTATIAQGQALAQANIANQNAMTATNAQGQALIQANNAATQAAIAQNNAVTATIAQGQALAQANIANQNAMTATNAQGQALVQANNAATSAANAQTAKQAALISAQQAQQSALSSSAEQLLLTDANTDLALALALRAMNMNATASPMTESILAETAYAQGTRQVLSGAHTDAIRAVAISPDGTLAVSAGQDKTLVLWNLKTGQPQAPWVGHTDTVTGVAFSPDGRTVVSSSADQTLIVWDVASGKAQLTLTENGQNQPILCVAILPDGKSVLGGLAGGQILQWDLQSGKIASVFRLHSKNVNAIAISVDGQQALSGSDDLTAKLWLIRTGAVLDTFGGGQTVQAVAIHPADRQIAVGYQNGAITLYNLHTTAVDATFSGHTNSILALAFDSSGTVLASGAADNTARLWDVATSRPLAILRGHIASVTAVAFTPDNRALLTASADKTLRLWNTINGAEIARLSDASPGSMLTISRDHRTLAAGYADGHIALIDPRTGAVLRTLTGQTALITALAFSPDSQTLLSASADTTLRFWNVATGQELRRFVLPNLISAALFLPDGQSFLTVGADVIVWDNTLNPTRKFSKPATLAALLTGATLSNDGQTLYTGSGADIVIWQVSSGTVSGYLKGGHSSPINALALSGDGVQLVSGSDDTTAIIWDVASGQIVHRLSGHTASVHTVAFSPDGQNVLTGSVDGTVRLWNAKSGAEIRRFIGHTQTVEGLVFSQPRQIISIARDGTERVWHIQSPDDLIAWVKQNRYVRDLTCDELFRFDPQAACPGVPHPQPVILPRSTPTPTLTPGAAPG